MSHPYGWLSLLPPLVAIVLAIATRRAVASLVAGIVCGAFITAGGHPGIALHDVLEIHLWPALIDPNKLRVFAFTLMMGAMIGIVCRSGGMQGLMRLVSPLANSRRSGQLTAWLSGLIIFFDDYANTVLLGGTLRPLCDRWRISREKLAYLVDSTAAPVAGLSLLSTWVAVEIDYLQEGLLSLPSATDLGAIDLFVGSIPYRFYVLSALLFIPVLALTGRDYGPMWRAERRRLRFPSDDDPQDGAESSSDQASANVTARWYNAVLPIVVTVLVVLGLFYVTGRQELGAAAQTPENGLKEIFGSADSYLSLYYGAMAGLLLSALLSRAQRLLSAAQIANAAAEGARVMVPALIILWCATALSRMTGDSRIDGMPPTVPYEYKAYRLYTADYLARIIVTEEEDIDTSGEAGTGGAAVTVKLLPTAVFLLAALLSFATGTSFGTMGILLPMVIPLTHALLGAEGAAFDVHHPILLGSVGSVLAGAIFGDHCSPISDTTILSSQSCGCDHMAHVVTQMPYALTVATLAIVLGTLPLGWGVSVWILLPCQLAGIVTVITCAGRLVE